ncbi:GntR family transcriptional regulator [Acrocarpospora catenulata]|uniref:GntR family transcriptional regulator n=1 Tax=Acrocarpospora catenulata TaxID=2836182 RepID=UPI001BDA3FC7|nr:GntR family transcriptional regulator [Acrocarpospora catenulata]
MKLPSIPIERRSVRERVTIALRAAIVSGDMQPGAIHSAPELASRFGVSATPVREAMMDLAREGMVVTLPNRGFQVTQVSHEDIEEITELRQIIEPAGLKLAAPHFTAADLDAMHAIARDNVRAATEKDIARYLESDLDFHLRILDGSGNKRLVETVQRLRAQTRLFGVIARAEEGTLADSAAEHIRLVDLLLANKVNEAIELLSVHIGHTRDIWQ